MTNQGHPAERTETDLVALWRRRARETCYAVRKIVYTKCADELEAALASRAAALPDEVARWKHAYETATHDACLCPVNAKGITEPACPLHGHIEFASPSERPTPADRGSVFRSAGPVMIGCIAPESRDAMDLALERYRKHAEAMRVNQGYVSDDPVYSFAYWLFRWSGIVTGVNLDAPENPWAPPAERPTPAAEGQE